MRIGDLLKIKRIYLHPRFVIFIGLLLECHPYDDPGPLRKTHKIKLLLSSGGLSEFNLYHEDEVEIIGV